MMKPESTKKGLNEGLIISASGPNKRPIEAFTRKGNRVYRHRYGGKDNNRFSDHYMFRVKKAGRQHYFNLGADVAKAKTMADQIASFLLIRQNTVKDLYEHSAFEELRSPRVGSALKEEIEPVQAKRLPSVGEFCDSYIKAANQLSSKSVLVSTSSLQRIAASILGLQPLGNSVTKSDRLAWRKKVNGMSLSKLTHSAIEKFRVEMIARSGSGHLKRAQAITSTNTYIRCARSMFAKKWQAHYEEFEFPNGNPFADCHKLPEMPHRYVSKLDPLKLFKKAKVELQSSNPAAFLVFTLALLAGMRRAEIDRLTWDQVDLKEGHIWIRTTQYFRPKAANSESRIDISSELIEILKWYRAKNMPPPFVIPGSGRENVRVRCLGTFRFLTKWLHANGIEEATALHTLRKEAGSLIFHSSGSVDTAAEFLRNDPRVAREHYIGRKGRLELDISALQQQVKASSAQIVQS